MFCPPSAAAWFLSFSFLTKTKLDIICRQEPPRQLYCKKAKERVYRASGLDFYWNQAFIWKQQLNPECDLLSGLPTILSKTYHYHPGKWTLIINCFMMFMNQLLLGRTSSMFFFSSLIHSPKYWIYFIPKQSKHCRQLFFLLYVEQKCESADICILHPLPSAHTLYILRYILHLHVDAFMVCKSVSTVCAY